MLVNDLQIESDGFIHMVLRLTGNVMPKNIEPGIYEGDSNYIKQNGTMNPFWITEEHFSLDLEGEYGVADSLDQVKASKSFQYCNTHPTAKFFLIVRWLYRKDQPEDGGWRWHKWGPYIGTQKPTHEYLYDDDHIEKVLLWHLYRVMDG